MKKCLTLAWLILLNVTCYSQQVTFSKAIDLGGSELGWSVISEDDGYVITGGSGYNIPIYHRRIFFLKTDLEGEINHTSFLADTTLDYFPGFNGSLKKTGTGKYILGGGWVDYNNNINYALLVKFNEFGDTIFTRKFGTAQLFDTGRDVVETPDGGYAIFGQTYSFGAGDSDYYLVKTDSNGNFLWQKTYGGIKNDFGLQVKNTLDSGFILTGYTNSFGAGDYDGWIVRTDSAGNKIWDKTYGTGGTDGGMRILPLANQDFTFIQPLDSPFFNNTYAHPNYVTRISSQGNIIWRKPLPYQDVEERGMSNFKKLIDGGYIVSGAFEDKTGSLSRIKGWITKLDETGDTIWMKDYYYQSPLFSNNNSYFYDVQPTPDGGFILSGFTTHNNQDIWLVKLDSKGCLVPGCDSIDAIIDISPQYLASTVYPNPFSQQATIEVSLAGKPVKQATCNIYDMQGKLVQEAELINQTSEQLRFQVKNTHLASGAYFYKVTSNHEVLAWGKMVRE